MNALTRKLLAVAATVAAAIGAAAITASPASAAVPVSVVSYTNAPTGHVAINETRCVTNHTLLLNPLTGTYMENKPLVVDADGPRVYAKDLTYAVDRGYVASRARLVDRTTNQITYGAFSPWTLAADNAPFIAPKTTFSGGLDTRHVYAVQQEIWWYNANGSTTTVVYQLQQYRQLTLTNNFLTSNTIQSNCVAS